MNTLPLCYVTCRLKFVLEFVKAAIMGIYYASFLYYGRLLSGMGHGRLMAAADPALLQQYLTNLTPDRWILHAPGRCINLRNIDPVLEPREVKAGFVEPAEVDKLLGRRPEPAAAWKGVTEAQLAQLTQFVRIAAGNQPKECFLGTYIVQIEWSTINPDHPGVVQHNIIAGQPEQV
jgi:hypothetical protein